MPGTSTEQVVDKGIRQKSIHSFTDGSAFCPGAPKRVPSDSEKHRRDVYTRHPTFVTATSGMLTRLSAKLSKNGMRVYTASEAKGLNKSEIAEKNHNFQRLKSAM